MENEQQQIDNPYEILGVDKNSSEEQIRSAYKKLALKYHPDKNPDDEEAARQFHAVSGAYAIVGDPQKRQQFDTGGHDRVLEQSQQVEVDPQNMNTMEKLLASMYSRVGLQVKTNVNLEVLEQVSTKQFQSQPLTSEWISSTVHKQQAQFYTMEVDQATIDEGFCIVAHSTPQQSRFKVLLFDFSGEGGTTWSLALQEDSVHSKKATIAGLYFLGFDTYSLDMSMVLDASEPEFHVFRQLDKFTVRQKYVITPGRYLVGVYGDNFIKKSSHYKIKFSNALEIGTHGFQLKGIEEQLTKKQKVLPQLEKDFRRIQEEYEQIVKKIKEEVDSTEELIAMRDEMYRVLHGLQEQPKDRTNNSKQSDLRGISNSQDSSNGQNQDQSYKKFSIKRIFGRGKKHGMEGSDQA